MIPLAVPSLNGRELDYLEECISTGYVSSVGPFVARFERAVADAAGARGGVATSAGTTGLHAALTAVGVGRDDLVILPTFTFIGSANAISHCGATPWLMDVTTCSWTLHPEQVQVALERDCVRRGNAVVHVPTGRRVAAIMPVHVLGCPADMDPMIACARRWGLPVVVDGAAALGAVYKGRPVGALGADLTVFSFNGNKTVTCGGGGAVVGDNERLVALVRHLTTTARCGVDYDHDVVGFNYRMTNLQAAVGCAQLEQLASFIAAKQAIQQHYADAFNDIAAVMPFPTPAYGRSACWFAGVILREGLDAQALRASLRERGIDARPFWKPIHLQKPYAAAPRADLVVAESIWRRIVTLPCSVGLTREEQEHVVAAIRQAVA